MNTHPGAVEKPDLSCEGVVFDIDRFASHDGPGIRMAVYLKGCPLRCIWCHSPESQSSRPELLYQSQRCTGCWLCLKECPEGALAKATGQRMVALDRGKCTSCGRCGEVCYPGALRMAGRRMAVGELVASALKERPFFVSSGGGITLTGGEPASQPAFAYNLLLACRQAGIHTALETTGCATWHVISRFVAVTDLFLYDVKLVDSRLHRKYTGVPNKRILDNLRRLALHGCQIQVRVPCIPGINDSEEHIASLARLVADMGVGRIALLPFNAAAGAKYEWLGREFPLRSAETQPVGHMESLARICHEAGLDVQVGG